MKKSKSKKNGSKFFNKPNGLVTIPKNVWGIASSVRVNLMYVESFLTTSLSGYATYRGNDLFDPQAAAAGITLSGNQQPQFADKWAGMYNKYRVLGSRIEVRLVNGSNPIPTFWEVSPEDQLVASSNAVQASVARFAKPVIMPYGSSSPEKKISSSMTTAQINGVSTEHVMDDDVYGAIWSQSPLDPWYWQIRYSSADFTTTAVVYGFVHIIFDCVLTDPFQDDDNDLVSLAKAKARVDVLEQRISRAGVAQLSMGKDEVKDDANDHVVVERNFPPSAYFPVPAPSPLVRNGKSVSFVKPANLNAK